MACMCISCLYTLWLAHLKNLLYIVLSIIIIVMACLTIVFIMACLFLVYEPEVFCIPIQREGEEMGIDINSTPHIGAIENLISQCPLSCPM